MADPLAKAMHSAVLADLGQTAVPPESNIVTNATTLQYFSSNFTETMWLTQDSHLPQMEGRDYDTVQKSSNPTGPLGITPSVISTKYLCQVPQRKPLGDIFIAVLLADLVLLQAAWKLYTFAVDQVLVRRRPSARYCEGCVGNESEQILREMVAKEVVLALQCVKGGIVTTTPVTRQKDGFERGPTRSGMI